MLSAAKEQVAYIVGFDILTGLPVSWGSLIFHWIAYTREYRDFAVNEN